MLQIRFTSSARNGRGVLVFVLVALTAMPVLSQSNPDVQTFFRKDIGLNESQIADIRNGKAVVKAMPSRTPNEIFLFGAIYIHATPESYVKLHHDFDRLRTLPNYLALGVFSDPPQFSDVRDFQFDSDDIKSLNNCKPGDCLIQMPETSIQQLRQAIDWSASTAVEQINQMLQSTALKFVKAYQHDGNSVLGTYNDKRDPTDVAKQFAYLLSYSAALPARLPDFYNYLLSYPNAKPDNVEDTFYWSRVKFGLKPTLRIVQLTTMQGKPGDEMMWAMAEKQLYSSHYFEAALDLSFCLRGHEDSAQPGFYLVQAMGSEQKGLTGLKGSIVRKAAIGRSLSSLQSALSTIRNVLETNN